MVSMLWVWLLISIQVFQANTQKGPDPWNYDGKPPEINAKSNLPPDIQMQLKKKIQTENKPGLGEWLFRRMLNMILKGKSQENEDGTIDISLQMKFYPAQWKVLKESLQSEAPWTEDMLRRSMGYVQESIYTPSIVEKIAMAWSDYVSEYLAEYKAHITWTLGFLATSGGLFWLWNRMSHRHVIIIMIIIFYAYEVFISYKEAEQKELDKFISAVERCKWFFWQSTCEVPAPDPLVFLKHMNPLKIAVRMFTTALAEPVVAISGTVEVMLHGITDGLWYPFGKIIYGILIVVINISLIYFLIMVIFNWLLNIPFHLSFGLFGISIRQRERTVFSNQTNQEQTRLQDADRVSEATIGKILDVCHLALSNNAQNRNSSNMLSINALKRSKSPQMRRSASTGRLPDCTGRLPDCTGRLPDCTSFKDNYIALNSVRRPHDGSGDA